MRPKRRVVVLDGHEASRLRWCFLLGVWGYDARGVEGVAALTGTVEAHWADVVLAVLPEREAYPALTLAQELGTPVLEIGVAAALLPYCVGDRSLAAGAPVIEVKESLRVLCCRKRGPKKANPLREPMREAARVS